MERSKSAPRNKSKGKLTKETLKVTKVLEKVKITKPKKTARSKSKPKAKIIESVDEAEIKDKLEDTDTAIMYNNILSGYKSIGPARIRLGLCCINNYLRSRKPTITTNRSMILSTYKSKGSKEAMSRALNNIKDVQKLIEWNNDHYIECLRLSSDMFPHYSNHRHIEEADRYELEFAKEELKKCGDLARKYEMRLTMHPGQFNVVGTPNEEAFNSTCVDLKMHADILDYMELDYNSILVVHGGGTYGDKETTIKRWIENFKRLPQNVQDRLVLENDEKNFNIVDCLRVSAELGIPVVFDNHHFNCYKLYHKDEKFKDISTYIYPAIETWLKKGLRPKFHISEQADDKNVGAHSDFIKEFPKYYLEIPQKYGIGIDIMIEAKAKEAAILDLYKRYRKNFLSHIDEEDLDDGFFNYNEQKLEAIKCIRCKY
jgi:UV DNA damage endonuclease